MPLVLNEEEQAVIVAVLRSNALQDLIGNEDWSLNDHQEEVLWQIIERVQTL